MLEHSPVTQLCLCIGPARGFWWNSREYLAGLLEYLESFYERTQPLSSLSKVASDFLQDPFCRNTCCAEPATGLFQLAL